MSRLIPAILLLGVCSTAFAAAPEPPFRATELQSVESIIQRYAEYLEAHPDDAAAHCRLGRVHLLAHQNKRTVLRVFRGSSPLPQVVMKEDMFREAPEPQPESPDAKTKPANVELTREQQLKHLAWAARSFGVALERDADNGLYRMLLADLLMEYADQPDNFTQRLTIGETHPPSDERKAEIIAQISSLTTDYDGVRPLKWLLEHGDEAEPFVFEKLQSAHNHEKPRLREMLQLHWKEQAIEYYAQAHNLSHERDIAGYNPAHGEPWDNFPSLRSGKLYLQLTAQRTDEKTARQAEQIRATFAALQKKCSEYKGPVR